MRVPYRTIGVVTAVLAVVVVCAAGFYSYAQSGKGAQRAWQHETAQQVSDLSAEDWAAVASSSTDAQTFASHLPVVSVNTNGQAIPGEVVCDENGVAENGPDGGAITTLAADGSESVAANVKTYDSQQGANRLTDTASLESTCQIRIRGNSSRFFDKKNYQLTLTNPDGSDHDAPFLGMEKSETWVLHGPELDKTLLRNYLTYNTASQFMTGFVPDVRFCEVFINGEYQGLYLAVESVKVESTRLALTPSDPKMASTSYLVNLNLSGETPLTVNDFLYYTLRMSNYLEVKYPSEATLTAEQMEWIEQDLNRFEKALFSYDYDTAEYGYRTFVDTQSFLDCYVLNEFVVNDDFGAYSTYLYKDVRGKLTLGPIWDYNNVYDNYENETPVDKFYLAERLWYFMMLKDEHFTDAVIARYQELRQSYLSTDALTTRIDETVDYLGPAIRRNYQKWGNAFDVESLDPRQKLSPDSRNPESYEEAIAQLKEFIRARGAWLDENIENLKQYSHESAVKKFNH